MGPSRRQLCQHLALRRLSLHTVSSELRRRAVPCGVFRGGSLSELRCLSPASSQNF